MKVFIAEVNRAEISLLARLRHPNILRFLGVAEHDGAPCLVTELAEETVASLLVKHRCLPPAQVSHWIADVADALVYLHGQGIVHGDVKPSNILIVDGNIRVGDIGAARQGGITSSRQGLMSAAYSAPEVFLRKAEKTPAIDAYALGITAYEMLVGAPPFTGDPLELLQQHTFESPAIPEALPGLWRHVLAGCLEKRPDRRTTVAEVARLLRQEPPPSVGGGRWGANEREGRAPTLDLPGRSSAESAALPEWSRSALAASRRSGSGPRNGSRLGLTFDDADNPSMPPAPMPIGGGGSRTPRVNPALEARESSPVRPPDQDGNEHAAATGPVRPQLVADRPRTGALRTPTLESTEGTQLVVRPRESGVRVVPRPESEVEFDWGAAAIDLLKVIGIGLLVLTAVTVVVAVILAILSGFVFVIGAILVLAFAVGILAGLAALASGSEKR